MAAAIEIRGLTKSYGSRPVVDGLSLTVERGSVYGLLGPNGSGKTTTLACTLGLLRPTSGSAHVLGEPAGRVHRLGGRLSVVFDTAISLPGLTALQNLEYVRQLLGHRRGRQAAEVLEAVGLESHARARVRSLSLGQAKRLAIAGALLGEPELLVLDEPLSGLDTLGVRRMLRLFGRLRDEGLTLLLSSHRLVEMESVVTHAGILFEGQLAEDGPLERVLARGEDVHRVEVEQAAEARALLEGVEGLRVEVEEGTDRPPRLALRCGELPVAEVNRRLVEAGFAVSAIELRRESLQTVFERIVDEREGRGAVA